MSYGVGAYVVASGLQKPVNQCSQIFFHQENGDIMPRPLPYLETPRLIIRIPEADETIALLDYRVRNREHLARFDPTPPPGFFERAFWTKQIEAGLKGFQDDRSCRLCLFPIEAKASIVGQVNLTEVVRGPLQACNLGYSLDYAREGTGLMSEALDAILRYAFDVLNLHRISANYIPHNERSGRLLKRLGFTPEGYARDYLRIDGRWQDHVLTSLTNPRWRPE